MADQDGVISHVDPAFCELVGRPRSELLGRHFLDITHPVDRDRNRAAVDRLFAEHRPFQIEKHYLRPDGSAVAVRNHVSLFPDEKSAPHMIAATELLPEFEVAARTGRREERDDSVFRALDQLAELAAND